MSPRRQPGPTRTARVDGPLSRSASVSAFADDALGDDDAVGLAERLARRDVSCHELRAAAVARAHAVDPSLNAVASWIDRPLGAAAADAPLRGIPAVIKDNEDVEGWPTTWGSAAVPRSPARRTTAWPAQFLRLGVEPIAKSALPEFGLTGSTESSCLGATRNPWGLAHSAGGSSGGSAALVAAGVVPLGHANDGGGSIRIPAACCGLVGLKPSRGRLVDRPERRRLPVDITTQGVLTRTVRDTAWYLAEAERLYRNPALPPVGHVRRPGGRRLRIGLRAHGMPGLPVEGPVIDAARSVATTCERLGHHVDELSSTADDRFGPDFLHYWCLLAAGLRYGGVLVFGPAYEPAALEPLTRALADRAVRHVPEVLGAVRRLRRRADQPEPGLDQVDVVLSPVVAHGPPPLGHLGPDVEATTHIVRLLRWVSFTPLQNVSGSPALALPAGHTRGGLPLGVQLVAPVGQEQRLLHLALELEGARL